MSLGDALELGTLTDTLNVLLLCVGACVATALTLALLPTSNLGMPVC